MWSTIQANSLLGDSTRARERLGWQPVVDFETLVKGMVETDLRRLATGVEESAEYL